CLERIRTALDLLRPIESYWAFPGKRVHKECERLFEARDFDQLGLYVAKVVRALINDSYRRRSLASMSHLDFADSHEHRGDSDHDSGNGREEDATPYFEVMVVDDANEEDEREVRMALLNLRKDDDRFNYDVVVVRSFED